jgi:hypothetical protein
MYICIYICIQTYVYIFVCMPWWVNTFTLATLCRGMGEERGFATTFARVSALLS